MYQMSVRELHARLANGADPPLLLDVREPWEFGICRIDGSKLLPMHRIVGSLGELDPERETVIICHHGIRSQQVALYLERQGFSRVINLQGGVDAWAQQVDPAMAIY
ncbi:MAG: sulfurtransferase [Chromatiaceae bacterium]|nr:sulfurtransferase [Chromatiaceae bacterium]